MEDNKTWEKVREGGKGTNPLIGHSVRCSCYFTVSQAWWKVLYKIMLTSAWIIPSSRWGKRLTGDVSWMMSGTGWLPSTCLPSPSYRGFLDQSHIPESRRWRTRSLCWHVPVIPGKRKFWLLGETVWTLRPRDGALSGRTTWPPGIREPSGFCSVLSLANSWLKDH